MTFFVFMLAIAAIVLLSVQLSEAKKQARAAAAHIDQLNQQLAHLNANRSAAGGQLAEAQRHYKQAARRIQELERELRAQAERHSAQLEKRAERAVAASRGSYDGHVAQQVFPAAPDHPYHPKDIFHFGGVVDYIVFDGLHDARYNGGDPDKITIVFADVKWGNSRLSDAQKYVQSAMNSGRTRFEAWHAKQTGERALTYERKAL